METRLPELWPGFVAVAKWPEVAVAVCGAAAESSWSGPVHAAGGGPPPRSSFLP